jgi:biopolymer transport protein ExbD
MLACVLVLLLISMMANPPHHGLAIDLYRSRNGTPMLLALRDDAMRLTLTRDGTIYFRNTRAASADLPDLIRQRVQDGSPRKMFFVVDARAKYRDVSIALDEVRQAGIWDIAFLAEAPIIHR